MGKLRTANNRRIRAARNLIGRKRAAAEFLKSDSPSEPVPKTKSARDAS